MMERIATFCALGEHMLTLKPESDVVQAAAAANPWFLPHEVVRAAHTLARTLLQRNLLEQWLSHYPALPTQSPERVRIIMAGNIPLVGFFDLLCVALAGHHPCVKSSSKDRIMMRWVVEQLQELNPSLPIDWEVEQQSAVPFDRLIATGSDETIGQLRRQHGSAKMLLRGSRHSVALLTGEEAPEEWEALADDLFAYSGLGCRNVSLLLMPRGATPALRVPPMNPLHEENYRQHRALMTLLGRPFTDCGGALLTEGEEFPTALSVRTVKRYDTLAEAEAWLEAHKEEIQCIVGRGYTPFGKTQSPALQDYPDGVDLMAWLSAEA